MVLSRCRKTKSIQQTLKDVVSRRDTVELLNNHATDFLMDGTGKRQAETLMLKRLASTHEKEILIVYYNEKCKSSDKIFKYEINPNSCFEEIVVDPRISKDDF